jgi:hypothetical protein
VRTIPVVTDEDRDLYAVTDFFGGGADVYIDPASLKAGQPFLKDAKLKRMARLGGHPYLELQGENSQPMWLRADIIVGVYSYRKNK